MKTLEISKAQAIADVLWFQGGAVETQHLAAFVRDASSPIPFEQLLQKMAADGLVKVQGGVVYPGEKLELVKPAWLWDGPPVWQPGDGDIKDVFNLRSPMGGAPKPGHFCFWTCTWEAYPTVLDPGHLADEQVYWTLRDIAALNLDAGVSLAASGVLIEMAGKVFTPAQKKAALKVVGRAKPRLPVYVPAWINKPIMNLTSKSFRPGWSWPFWATRGGLPLVVTYTRQAFTTTSKPGVISYG